MNRLIAITALMIVVPGALMAPANGSSQVAEAKADDSALVCPYYPLKVGNTWEYLSGTKKPVVKVAAHEKVDGVLCARLETDLGAGVVTEHITVKADGVYRVRANSQEIKPPLLLLKLDPTPKKGDDWAIYSTVQNFDIKGKFIVGEEKLTVGKAEYATISVKSSDMKMGDQVVTMEAWYAKDIGMVKQHFKLPVAELDVVLELDKFTPGK